MSVQSYAELLRQLPSPPTTALSRGSLLDRDISGLTPSKDRVRPKIRVGWREREKREQNHRGFFLTRIRSLNTDQPSVMTLRTSLDGKHLRVYNLGHRSLSSSVTLGSLREVSPPSRHRTKTVTRGNELLRTTIYLHWKRFSRHADFFVDCLSEMWLFSRICLFSNLQNHDDVTDASPSGFASDSAKKLVTIRESISSSSLPAGPYPRN